MIYRTARVASNTALPFSSVIFNSEGRRKGYVGLENLS
jgi:hypothetical protein